MGGLLGMEADQRGEFLCCCVPVGEQKHRNRIHETCLNTFAAFKRVGGGERKYSWIPKTNRAKWPLQSGASASSANTSTHACTHAHTCIINAFHFKVLPIFWWHSHSSRVKQHLAASISIIKYFKQHPASTSVTPSRPMQLSFLSESVSICICHPPHTFTSYQSLCQDAK